MSHPIPEWSARITADIAARYNPEIKDALMPFHGQPLNKVWVRLPINVRTALIDWWSK